MFGSDEDLDAAWLSWLSFDEAGSFEGKDHLMDRWRGDLEVALHVGFGGRSSVDAGVGVNEGEILFLLFGEAGLRRGVTGGAKIKRPPLGTAPRTPDRELPIPSNLG